MFRCRKSQGVYDQCMLDNMGLERPHWGYFSKAKIHDTKRPKPPPPEIQVYPDATPALPDDYPRHPNKYGGYYAHQ
ncbi:unnamed protein product [Nesidiocoris tenuis]|uniref:Uncharacterized protein n=1 Tax=Nesidiocoris tenuis TaxID=355587 RepID=A0A6H5HQB8_9HEMI|nr:unnamed protein product [Nesidiocoris tenuis]